MKPAPFEYHRPRRLDDALATLAAHGGDAKPLAGGQSLIPAMNFRLATPAVLVDLNEIPELAFIREPGPDAPASISLGAMTRHRTVERSDVVRNAAPLLHEAMPFIAHTAIRTRGTIGGSLAHADPAAELPAVMLALEATLITRGVNGKRQIPALQFFAGLFTTALEPGELLTEIRIPIPATPGWRYGSAFQEFSRRHGDFALAGVAAAVSIDDADRVTSARIALFSVGDRPLLARRAAETLVGSVPSPAAIRAAAELAAAEEIDPTSDIHASSSYRRQLARVLTQRALTSAFQKASRH